MKINGNDGDIDRKTLTINFTTVRETVRTCVRHKQKATVIVRNQLTSDYTGSAPFRDMKLPHGFV